MDVTLRALILAAIAIAGPGPGAQARDFTNLPAEIGAYGPTASADARVVPGVAGTWFKAVTQTSLRDTIFEHARKQAPGCATPQVVMTYTAMPDVMTAKKTFGIVGIPVAQRAFQLWDIDVCGAKVTYLALLMWEGGQVYGGAKPLQDWLTAKDLSKYDQPVKLGIESRQQARAVGMSVDLNLPMPTEWNWLSCSHRLVEGWRPTSSCQPATRSTHGKRC